jgi:hypothetical protein
MAETEKQNKEKALQEYRKKMLEYKQIETKVKARMSQPKTHKTNLI